MKLSQLRYFKTVAELGKITLAADAIHISPPALSASITSLEEEMSVALFNRTSNRIVLNQQGEIFLRYVNQIFNNIECAKLEIRQSLENTDEMIYIAVTTSNLWPPLIADFSMACPDIMVSCTTLKLSRLDNFNISHLHAFILAEQGDFNAAGLESVRLFEEKPMAILPPDHPLAQRESLELIDLQNEILFLPMADQSLNKRIKEMFYENMVPLRHVNECSDSIRNMMVSEGRGISFATTHTFHTTNTTLKYIPIEVPNCHWEQHIFWQKSRPLSCNERAFKEFILNRYGVS